MCWSRASQHGAGRLSTALGSEQHLVQPQRHLGLICRLVFTLQLSVSCEEQCSTKMPLVNGLLSGLVQLCTSLISLIPSVSGNVVEGRARVELSGCRDLGESPGHPTAASWPSLIIPAQWSTWKCHWGAAVAMIDRVSAAC